MSAEELLAELEVRGTERAHAIAWRQRTDAELAELFRKVQQHPELEVKAAAERAGIGRSLAYKLMRESGRQD